MAAWSPISSPLFGRPTGRSLVIVGDSVLVERIGRRLSTIEFADRFAFQVLDQKGAALFANDFKPNPSSSPPETGDLLNKSSPEQTRPFRAIRAIFIPSVVSNRLAGWRLWSSRWRWLTGRFTIFWGE